MKEKKLNKVTLSAAKRLMERKGYVLLPEEWNGDMSFVARDDDEIVFISVQGSFDGTMPEEKFSRNEWEVAASHWFLKGDAENIKVRFDIVSVSVLSSDRALVRHHINALG